MSFWDHMLTRLEIFRKVKFLAIALRCAIPLNVEMLFDRLKGYRVVVFHVSAASQIVHIEPVLSELCARESRKHISLFVLTRHEEIARMESFIDVSLFRIRAEEASRFLFFCNFFLSVDQGMVFPYFGCKTRACCFHGQPSKGNTYQIFNYRKINALFFYGPLMRDYYLYARRTNTHWPTIKFYEVGQPLSDSKINRKIDKGSARKSLGLNPSRFTVVYAPSFEYCSSLALHGSEIIEFLLSLEINLIVKPHPAFYCVGKFRDEFNLDIPNFQDWNQKIVKYNSKEGCLFPLDGCLDTTVALSASDVMLVDYSGVAFDGILMDIGMIYWDCPTLYSEYLPRRYNIDGSKALTDLACNVGRDAGIVVRNIAELGTAISVYQKDPGYKKLDREIVRDQLLFNPGNAAVTMAEKIEEIMRVYD
ncbi:hypothetical protein CCP3SC1AL1_2350004 [Gammaproteobacteria bacterium]